jgi:hypothetical protein
VDNYFINEQTGWVVGMNVDSKTIFKTTNGGFNWIEQNNPISTGSKQINNVKFINENTGWVAALTNTILRTTNGGTNWCIDFSVNSVYNEFWCLEKNLKNIVWAGSSMVDSIFYRDSLNVVGIFNISSEIPDKFYLFQNYPNPFNPTTNIKYQIAKSSFVNFKIYDMLGREVETLVNEKQLPGTYETTFNASQYPSGVYFYRLTTEGFSETNKMILLK